jgi:cysteinyl-tRNA synthetase
MVFGMMEEMTFSKVIYVRNITDIDDKIIRSLKEQKISKQMN